VEETALLTAARDGDEDAFAALVAPHRRDLQAHCYRMLGSLHDAEDVLQESLVRAWTGLHGFDGRGPVRPWLFRIATNRCLTLLERRHRRELPADLSPGAPLEEVRWLEPYPQAKPEDPQAGAERRESVTLAFVAALQYLSPSQRAALLLREVLGFSAAEVADQLGTSVPAVNSALQRARKVIAQRVPRRENTDSRKIKEIAEEYAAAWHAGDVDAIVSMLAKDATFSMPPHSQWFRGHEDIREFLLSAPLNYRWRLVPCEANGQLAFGSYVWNDDLRAYRFVALDVLTIERDRVAEVVAFLDKTLWEPFGLPPMISR
jgi:RNA polymerase sigma-70 factor (TIGR02960 family)